MAEETTEFRRKTFILDTVRAVPAGVVETLGTTFTILLAERVYQAGNLAKASLVAMPSLGLLLSLFVVQAVRRSGVSVNAMLSLIFAISGAGFAVASLAGDRFDIYLTGMTVALITVTLNIPLFSQIYQKHYPRERRGGLFSITAFLRKIFAISTAALFGWLLTESLGNYPILLWSYSGASFLMALCVLAMDRVTLSRSRQVKLFEAFRHVSEDKPFRRMLVSWMILGSGNLLCFSLFVEYITNKEYGFDFSENQVSFITTVIPEFLFFVFVLVWGRLFDRINFYVLRCLINLFFGVGILFYYLGDEIWCLYLGIALHGVARAGGNVAWSLWVTKFSPAEHVAEYMSVHTFLTGCRGVIAPFIAFWLLAQLGPGWVGGMGAGLIFLATLMLGPSVMQRRPTRES